MLDHDDGQAARAQLIDTVEQLLNLGGVQAGGGLVDHEQARRGRKRARELEHPLLAVGERRRVHGRPRLRARRS